MDIHSGRVTRADLKRPRHDWSEINQVVRGLKPGVAKTIPIPPDVSISHLRSVALGRNNKKPFMHSPWRLTSLVVIEDGEQRLKVFLVARAAKR